MTILIILILYIIITKYISYLTLSYHKKTSNISTLSHKLERIICIQHRTNVWFSQTPNAHSEEDISKLILILRAKKWGFDDTRNNFLSDKMVINFYMVCSLLKNEIGREMQCWVVITYNTLVKTIDLCVAFTHKASFQIIYVSIRTQSLLIVKDPTIDVPVGGGTSTCIWSDSKVINIFN